MAKIDDTTTEELRGAVVQAMARMASQGSVPAATAVLKVLDQIEDQEASLRHNEALRGPPQEVAHYLGMLDATKSTIERILGHPLTPEEEKQRKAGSTDRQLEVRAIELSRVRAGAIAPPKWAQKS